MSSYRPPSAVSRLLILLVSVILFLVAPLSLQAQSSQWRWVSGSIPNQNCTALECGQAGVYGTQGVYAATNVPGSREGASSWIDASGNLWLFGGQGFDSTGVYIQGNERSLWWLNDLWEYSPSLGQWRWMGGSADGNQVASYGTQGAYAVGNVPGGRLFASAWADASGNFWLFGGCEYPNDMKNDLWEYSPSLGQWRWMGGSEMGNQAGSYGTQGAYAASNVPSGRGNSATWADAAGNLWLFGGALGISDPPTMNDLWEYSPTLGQWRWVGGSYLTSQPGSYGTQGVYAAGNEPGARYYSYVKRDASGVVWLFGGLGYDSSGAQGSMNDLWEYNPTIGQGQWRWVSGSNLANQPGSYGTQGAYAAGNVPGARESVVGLIDSSHNLWLFGGFGPPQPSYPDFSSYLNDVWEYSPSLGQWRWVSGYNVADQPGSYGRKASIRRPTFPQGRRIP